MKSKGFTKSLLITSIVLSVIMTLGTILQFGDYYYALNAGGDTPQSITDRLSSDGSMDVAMVAGLRQSSLQTDTGLRFSPVALIALIPAVLLVIVFFMTAVR